MKRLAATIAALTVLAGPLSESVAHADPGHGRGQRWERSAGERGNGRGRQEWRGREDRGGGGQRWDRGYDGPPRQAYPGPSPRMGARRGGYLPDMYRGQMLNDYGRYRLRPPPRGYAWYRQGDTYLLVDQYTGQVFDVIQ